MPARAIHSPMTAYPETIPRLWRGGQEVPWCSLTENFWREQPIGAALRTFRPSTGLELTPVPWTAAGPLANFSHH